MPRKNKQSKNKRRVAAAEQALSRIPTTTARKRKPQKRNSPKRSPVSLLDTYCQSVTHDVLVPTIGLPSRNHAGPVMAYSVKSSFGLNAANHSSLVATVVANPYLAMFEDFNYEKLNAAAAEIAMTMPTVFTNTTASGQGIPVSPNITQISATQMIGTSHTTAYTGRCRCTGMKFRITYLGPWTNKGGELLLFTNPDNISLACQLDSTTTAGQTFNSAFLTNAELDQSSTMVTRVPIGDVFEFVWRPRNVDFYDYKTNYPNNTALAGTTAVPNSLIADYLPQTEIANAVVTQGWVTGFQLRPAAGTAATALPYRCEIEAFYEATVNFLEYDPSGQTVAGRAYYTPTHVVSQNSAASDKIANHLASTHHARQHNVFAHGHNLSLAKTAEKAGSAVVRSAAAGLAEAAGARIAALF